MNEKQIEALAHILYYVTVTITAAILWRTDPDGWDDVAADHALERAHKLAAGVDSMEELTRRGWRPPEF